MVTGSSILPNKTKKPASLKKRVLIVLFGGPEGNRTLDLLNAIQALSQLSYKPDCCCVAPPCLAATYINILKRCPIVNRIFKI
jgi:hypothetical protein